MNFIDYKGDLEISVNYGGKPLLKGIKTDVKGDHLIHALDVLNGEIITGMEELIKKITNSKVGNYKNYKDFIDKEFKP